MSIEIIKVDMTHMPSDVPLPKDFEITAQAASDWIKANPGQGRKKYAYIRFHQYYEGEILQTVYAVKWCKPTRKTPEQTICQLVFAGTPTTRWTSGNLLYGRLCGYFVLWDENEGRSGMISYYGFDPTMYIANDDTFNPSLNVLDIEGNPGESEADLLALRNWPPYMNVYDMMQDCSRKEIIEYCREFEANPVIERLQKAGISYLWNEKRLTHAKPKFSKKLLTYIKKNIKEIRGRHPDMSFILKAMKLDMTIDQYEWYEVVMAVDTLLCGLNGYFMHEQANEVAKYIQKQNGGPVHYRDYLDLSAKMGRNMDDRGVLFPRDFCKQFDEMNIIYEAQRNEMMEKNIQQQLEALGLPKRYDHKGFSVRILDTQKSMTEIGNELHNCVGTSGYGMRMADGQIVILAVYCNGKPVNCVELATPKDGRMYQIVQNRGDHNRDSECQEQVQQFLTGYISEANKSWRQCHASA